MNNSDDRLSKKQQLRPNEFEMALARQHRKDRELWEDALRAVVRLADNTALPKTEVAGTGMAGTQTAAPEQVEEMGAARVQSRPKYKRKGGPKENPDIDLIEKIWSSAKTDKTGRRNIEAVRKEFIDDLKSKKVERIERQVRWDTAYPGFRQRRKRSKPTITTNRPPRDS
jgi:hypothetical protein